MYIISRLIAQTWQLLGINMFQRLLKQNILIF